eukprot:4204032-Alexandrium_andersonii.AAC.1
MGFAVREEVGTESPGWRHMHGVAAGRWHIACARRPHDSSQEPGRRCHPDEGLGLHEEAGTSRGHPAGGEFPGLLPGTFAVAAAPAAA